MVAPEGVISSSPLLEVGTGLHLTHSHPPSKAQPLVLAKEAKNGDQGCGLQKPLPVRFPMAASHLGWWSRRSRSYINRCARLGLHLQGPRAGECRDWPRGATHDRRPRHAHSGFLTSPPAGLGPSGAHRSFLTCSCRYHALLRALGTLRRRRPPQPRRTRGRRPGRPGQGRGRSVLRRRARALAGGGRCRGGRAAPYLDRKGRKPR